MITAKTYTVGNNGGVRRLDDLTGTWSDVSITNIFPQASSFNLFDVETDPLDGNKVFAVGEGDLTKSAFGIYVSPNGGNAWYIPGGNYQTNTDLAGKQRWNEVWVLSSSHIMVAGDNGYVAISTNGGVTFNLTAQLPPLPSCGICPPIIPTCWSVHFINPMVGVVGLDAHVALTINGGASWTILNSGNIITGPPNGELFKGRGIHMSADQMTIVVVNEKSIFRSIDGGVNWLVVHNYASRNGRHLTWINDQELWAFGTANEIVKSVDAGATWTILSAWNPSGPAHYAGQFYLGQNGFYSTDSDILSTNNGASSGVTSETAPYLIQAVWTWFQDITCYQLTACDGITPSILVDNDLSASVGQVLLLCPSDLPPIGGSGMGGGVPMVPNPGDPGNTAFSLVDCCGTQPTIVVTNNLLPYLNGIVVIPSLSFTTCRRVLKGVAGTNMGLVDITGGTFYADCPSCLIDNPCTPLPVLTQCTCFTISITPDCNNSITLLNVGSVYPNCLACTQKCYLLIDCLNVNNFIITSDDLAQYVGMVIHLEECPDTCWQVSLSNICDNSVCISDVIASFPTCQACLPPPPPPAVLELHPRRVKPGYYTAGCPPAYTEHVSCIFGDQMYNQMLVDRYGLTICCEQDRDKWSIKKQLLDFKALFDPALCKCFMQSCCAPTCLEVILQVFDPQPCPAPVNASAIITLGSIPCTPPEINFVWLQS